MASADIGLCFHRDAPASDVVLHAREAERLGFDEFWVIEDCFFTSGPTLAAAALTATETIGVGIGIMPAVARNAAVTAMEIATLAGLAPGRFHAGIGHGVQSWMEQMNGRVDSPLTVLSETLDAVRGLLAGQRLTIDGRYVTLRDVGLEQPPSPVPLVSAGVRGPKSLQLSGQHADGTILADFCSPDYVRWAREQIGTDDHRITVFASLGVATDPESITAVQTGMGFHLADVAADAPISLRMAPCFDELAAQAERSSWAEAIDAMPASNWSELAPVGSPEDAANYITDVIAAGADAVALFPSPFDPLDDARLASEVLLPLLN